MSKKKLLEPVPELPIPRPTLDTMDDIIAAIDRVRATVEFRLEHNRRQQVMLETSKIRLQMVRNMLRVTNDIAVEAQPDPQASR